MNQKKVDLDTVFKGTRRDSLRKAITKDNKSQVIQIRVTENHKTQMQALAKSCDMSLTDYLTRLHVIAYGKLEEK